MSNPLVNIAPDRWRKRLYALWAGLGLALGSVPVYCSTVAAETPVQVLGALAVYAFLAGPLFGMAASNVAKG